MKLLSILIPTISERKGITNDLCRELLRQMGYDSNVVGRQIKSVDNGREAYLLGFINYKEFEIILCGDNKQMTIGRKRNILYENASGLYSWQIDDDDWVHENSIPLIMKEIEKRYDCVTFQEYCLMNGTEYKSNHSILYDDWAGDGSKELSDGFHFQRTPFYKDVILTKIAKSVQVPNMRFGEDHEWSKLLKPHLKNEGHLDTQIYRYIHESNPENHNERYGINIS